MNENNEMWSKLEAECKVCRECGLCERRTNVVFGRGSKNAAIMFIGEGPGQQEDEEGVPFVGAAGKLLNNALIAQEFSPDSYYIANIVKCRPENNREPTAQEAAACKKWLKLQTKLLHPKIIVCLGNVALKNIIDANAGITKARGTWIQRGEYMLTATYHPAALLRDDSKKADFWRDLQSVKKRYEESKGDGLI